MAEAQGPDDGSNLDSAEDVKDKPASLSGVELTSERSEGKSEGDEGFRTGEENEKPLEEVTKIALNRVPTFAMETGRTNPYLPGEPVIVTVTIASSSRGRRAANTFKVNLEHGPFQWCVRKTYWDFLSLRSDLEPMRLLIRRVRRRVHSHGYLPHLLSIEDVNIRTRARVRNQLPKVARFMNAVMNNHHLRTHPSTLKFLEVSRLSFIEDLGSKRKEGQITKRSGGHRRVTNCLGCTACCSCRFSVWRLRWFVLKDSFVTYIRSDRRTVAGVLLFEEGTTVEIGLLNTGIQRGLKITTRSRELLVKCNNQQSMRQWRDALQDVLATTGKIWMEKKRFDSFAPVRKHCTAKWFVDGEKYMAAVADALLAAKEEIFITDWMISPHIFLRREITHTQDWRLGTILLKKAEEGVKVYIQLYKEIQLALNLGSDYVLQILSHPNIVVFRHPEHIQTGVYLWAHHEKIVVIDQTLAFVGGIDLAFGRWDNACHHLTDQGQCLPHSLTELAKANVSADTPTNQPDDGAIYQTWVGKDYYNPFVKDFIQLAEPLQDQLDRRVNPRMPWHDIASCVFGAAARDVARHFVQRFNFTKHEQSQAHFLLPRQAFDVKKEQQTMQYLLDVLLSQPASPISTNATVQIVRSLGEWSGGVLTEHSIHNAYLSAIENAEHFVYIENQFFVSSLVNDNVHNGVAEALRQRIVRAYKEKKVFRVIIVMPLLPSFEGEFGESSGTILEAVIHWNYRSISRGSSSLIGRLISEDGIPPNEVHKFISVYGLRTHSILDEKPVSEIVYVHSKCMVVDDRLTIIGSANVNDRSMLGERDSEVAILVQDQEMMECKIGGQSYQVGKFSHTLRCHLFKEHLGLLESQGRKPHPEISVEDPVVDEFYLETWMKSAEQNTEIYEEVFGGKCFPTDQVLNYQQLKTYKENPGLIGRDTKKAKERLKHTQGVLVSMPLKFLEDEDLLPVFGTQEYFAPDKLVT